MSLYDPKLCTIMEPSLSLHQSRAVHVPSLLNHRADTLSRKRDSSRRGEVSPRVSSDDLDPVRDSGGGSVRHERECALPAERGRADIALASSQAVCISSNQYIATGVM